MTVWLRFNGGKSPCLLCGYLPALYSSGCNRLHEAFFNSVVEALLFCACCVFLLHLNSVLVYPAARFAIDWFNSLCAGF
ncbi:hypothetical protein BIZ37_03950 [Photobacterium sp. BZF1]|uniref:hypothetical protein n=1 Tax=Photobacterium sp. BZF1 TaxID=1904457 RepID=UPI001653EB26|nr:hypothetical protein [Photobacterium sp. BZF1]MBC7001703.1 hypothetical protein [Photobacterium sp. BZF1]